MSENMNELYGLEELKAAYNLMDERLDGQEIVSDEQLREAMYRKFTDMRQNAKEGIIWANLILVPVFAWQMWYHEHLSLPGFILLGIYWVASLVFKLVVLRKTKKEDYGSYDLKTLVDKESRYAKNIKWGSIAALVFFEVFFLLLLVGKGKGEWILFVILCAVFLVPLAIRWLIIKYKYNGQTIDPATGRPRVLGGRWQKMVGYALMGLSACLFALAAIFSIAGSTGWLGVLRVFDYISVFIAFAILVMGMLHSNKRITVSRRLLLILSVIAIAMSASVVGIATLLDITELVRPTNLFTTVSFSAIGVFFLKMKK